VQRRYCGGKGITLSREISEQSRCVEKRINIPKRVKEIAEVYLIQNGEIIKDLEKLICEKGDILILFAESKYDDFLEKWIYQEL